MSTTLTTMTANELIAQLKEADPTGNAPIEVPVRTFTQAYPSAYLEPHSVEMGPWQRVRITVSFPEGFVVSERKK